jgi:glutamate-1-semialdehyde 2,1-aminomutase
MNSEELFKKSLHYVPGGVHSPVRSFKGLHTTPRFINRAEGAYIYDEDGKDYIDFCMSFGPLILGHRNALVEQAVIEALSRGWSYGACEKYSLELAEYIVENIKHIEQIRFVNSGTEAVMTAIRLARGFTGKNKIIKFNGCYHGHTDAMLIKAGSGLAGSAEASSGGVTHHIAEDTLICELGDLEAVKAIFHDHKNEIAAIFIEPLPANNGLLEQCPIFLKALKEICTQEGALLVFDEVISGFRVAFGGMAQKLNIDPDLVTYGKIIGGGFPVGAIAGKKEIMQCLAPIGSVYQAGTLSANPVAMVAGLVNLKQLTDNFYKTLDQQSEKIKMLFSQWMAGNGFNDYEILSYSSLFWAVPDTKKISDITKIPTNLTERFYELFKLLLNKGIYLAPNAYEVGFVSMAHDDTVISDLKNRLWK